MKCPQCGDSIRGKLLFCPRCGHKLVQPSAGGEVSANSGTVGNARADGAGSSGCLLSLTVLVAAAAAVLAIVAVGLAGVYFGTRDRANTERQAAEQHYTKGLAHLAAGEFELAIAELEVAVQLSPENGPALARLAEAREKLEVRPSPTPVLLQEILAAYLGELRAAHEAGEWQRVFELADRLLATDASYHRSEVDEMLFDGFYNSGLELVEQDRMREAGRLLSRALALRPGSAEVQRAERLATLYLTAMAYWNADWAKGIETLESLYDLAPEYKDVRQRLHDAYVNDGDLLAKGEDWCEAEQRYARALAIIQSGAVDGKREDAGSRCAARPTETAEGPTSTPLAEGETPAPESESPLGPSGVFVGRLVERTETHGSRMFVRGKVLDKEGEGVQDVQVQIKAWDWSAMAVSDGYGQYSFDGLSTAVTYTLSLVQLPSRPVDVAGIWGRIAWVNFEETE